MKKTVVVLLTVCSLSAGVRAAGLMEKVRASSAFRETVAKTYTARDGSLFRYRWHEPSVKASGKKYPLVVLLHGAGERGTNNVSQLVWGAIPLFDYMKKRGQDFFFLAGQVPRGKQWVDVPWTTSDHRLPAEPSATMAQLIELLARLRETEPALDPDRIYATGVSMGGYGTWDLVSRKPGWFAAAMPVCGGGDVEQAAALRDLPVFIHHGDVDGAVPVWRGRSMIAALRNAGSLVARYTEYPGCGHGSWIPAYGDEKNFDWLFSKKRPAPAAWTPVTLTAAELPVPAKTFDVAFEFSGDGGASWREGFVRRAVGFPLFLVDDRVTAAPGYDFRQTKTGWTLAAPAGGRAVFRNVRTRPIPAN